MKALLLGPNGQLGTDIRLANDRRGEPLEILGIGRAQIDLADIEAAISSLRDLDFDALINCSSYHKTDEVEKNAQLAFTINSHLVKRLSELTAEKGVGFFHVSTDYVFGGQPQRSPLPENAPKSPINVYGASKAMGEDLALAANDQTRIVRVASLFGVAGASGKGGNFVETMLRLGKEKGELRVVADQTMSPTSTQDVAETMLDMVLGETPPGIWHVVNSEASTWFEFAEQIISDADVDARVFPIMTDQFPTPAARPLYSALDNQKISEAVRPMRPWRDALTDYLVAKGHRQRKVISGSPR
jgi:dTDP-4-dehydrorhamnose reductase